MGHHGSEEPSAALMSAFDKVKEEDRKKAAEEHLKREIGATGKFPMGKLDQTDEGEIAFAVASHEGKVLIRFGKPVAWMGMDARQAIMLAAALLKNAQSQQFGIMNGDHAQFEIDHAKTRPQDRPDWPYPSFDARDWARAFSDRFIVMNKAGSETKPVGDDEGLMLTWFANALMRGFDEAERQK